MAEEEDVVVGVGTEVGVVERCRAAGTARGRTRAAAGTREGEDTEGEGATEGTITKGEVGTGAEFDLWPSSRPNFENFNIGSIFWCINCIPFIFDTHYPSGKSFSIALWYDLDLWPCSGLTVLNFYAPLWKRRAYCFAPVGRYVGMSVGRYVGRSVGMSVALNLVQLITQECFPPEASNLVGR